MREKDIQELARIARREYHRAWRAKNKEKIKATNARYWAKKATQLLRSEEQSKEDKSDEKATD